MLQVILAIVVAYIFSIILTYTNVFPDDKSHIFYKARTDSRLTVLNNANWFRFPYPGMCYLAIQVCVLSSYLDIQLLLIYCFFGPIGETVWSKYSEKIRRFRENPLYISVMVYYQESVLPDCLKMSISYDLTIEDIWQLLSYE